MCKVLLLGTKVPEKSGPLTSATSRIHCPPSQTVRWGSWLQPKAATNCSFQEARTQIVSQPIFLKSCRSPPRVCGLLQAGSLGQGYISKPGTAGKRWREYLCASALRLGGEQSAPTSSSEGNELESARWSTMMCYSADPVIHAAFTKHASSRAWLLINDIANL